MILSIFSENGTIFEDIVILKEYYSWSTPYGESNFFKYIVQESGELKGDFFMPDYELMKLERMGYFIIDETEDS